MFSKFIKFSICYFLIQVSIAKVQIVCTKNKSQIKVKKYYKKIYTFLYKKYLSNKY